LSKIVYIARHGQTDWNREKRFQGQYDIPLNNTGRQQAMALAGVLKNRKIEQIFTSPKKRAVETAEIINRELKKELEIIDDLREISHGIYDGMTLDEVYSKHSSDIKKWREDRINIAPPEGESIKQCADRVIPVYDSIVENSGDKPILIISHMVVTKSILIHCLNVPMNTFWRFDQGSTALNRVRYAKNGPVVDLLNYTSHLDNL
jgi:broad specificity phosphatase PhoE